MKQNTLIILVVLVAIGAIGWMVYKQQQAKAAAATPGGTNINATLTFGGTQPPPSTATVRSEKRVVMV